MKIIEKITQKWQKLRSGTSREPNHDQNTQKTYEGQITQTIFEVILGVILAPKIW